jgi:hypothetical protein
MSDTEKTKSVQDFIFNDEVQNILSTINDNVMDFNILEITGMGSQEIKHSNILGWLFDDSEHSLEYQILDNFLKKVIELNTNNELQSYLYLSNKKRDITIYREKDNIDLLIVDESNKIVITIENKLYASERTDGVDGGQLQKYEKTIHDKYNNNYKKYFIYLTIDLEEPSKENWLRANHQMITDVIDNILETKETTTKTQIVLESYVDLLKRNGVVADKKLEELCKQIWANKDYRNALKILINNEPTNHKIISNAIIDKLRTINIEPELYANKDNDILFKTKSISQNMYDNNILYFNIYFDSDGIILAIYIDTKDEQYQKIHKALFPEKNKINNRNQIIKKSKDWNDYINNIGNENIENEIKDDIEDIINAINIFEDKILKIKL